MKPPVTIDPPVPFTFDERRGTVKLLQDLPLGTVLRINYEFKGRRKRRAAARAANLPRPPIRLASHPVEAVERIQIDGAPAGLQMLRQGVSWEETDLSLAEMAEDLKAKADSARQCAQKARDCGDIVRWRRLSDVARSYSVALLLLGTVRSVK